MENPAVDIKRVILDMTETSSPETQQNAVEKYMTEDVCFLHPVCWVKSGPNSRATVLKVYQWYRILSPTIDLTITDIMYDSQQEVVYVDITQSFKLFFLSIQPAPARLITWLKLRKVENLYYISQQEDFYHTLSFTALLFPPLIPLVSTWLTLAGFFSYWAAAVGQRLGYWAPKASRDSDIAVGDHEDLYE